MKRANQNLKQSLVSKFKSVASGVSGFGGKGTSGTTWVGEKFLFTFIGANKAYQNSYIHLH